MGDMLEAVMAAAKKVESQEDTSVQEENNVIDSEEEVLDQAQREEPENPEVVETKIPEEENPKSTTSDQLPRPPSWSKRTQAEWESLPRAVQEEITKSLKNFQSDYTQKTQKIAEKDRKYSALEQIESEFGEYLKPMGLDVPMAARNAIALTQELDADVISGVDRIVRSYGITPEQFIQEWVNRIQTPVAPEVIQLRKEQESLKRQLQQVSQPQTNDLASAITDLSQRKTISGEPMYPYFEELGSEIAAKIPQVVQEGVLTDPLDVIDEAYQRAFNPFKDLYMQKKRVAEIQKSRSAESLSPKPKPSGQAIGTNKPKNMYESVINSARKLGYEG